LKRLANVHQGDGQAAIDEGLDRRRHVRLLFRLDPHRALLYKWSKPKFFSHKSTDQAVEPSHPPKAVGRGLVRVLRPRSDGLQAAKTTQSQTVLPWYRFCFLMLPAALGCSCLTSARGI
jgi:hypothetical protein